MENNDGNLDSMLELMRKETELTNRMNKLANPPYLNSIYQAIEQQERMERIYNMTTPNLCNFKSDITMDEETRELLMNSVSLESESHFANIETAHNTEQTAKEIDTLNEQVANLSKTLDEERKDRENEKQKNQYEQKISQLEDNISEYTGRFWNTVGSLFSFLVTLYIFFYENLTLTKPTTLIPIVLVGIYHGVSIVYHSFQIIYLNSKLKKVKEETINA